MVRHWKTEIAVHLSLLFEMLILSWNVAGFSTTVKKLDANYGCKIQQQKRKKDPSAVIGDFFRRHQADIVCLQEAKIPKSSLEARSEPLQCAHVDGYESFWCCNVGADTSKRGFNGVVTYCKTGTVVSADSRPLKCPELDDQGRCVMTDHGNFVLFNVYVPAGGGNPLSFKMKFLRKLREAMKFQREECHKQVILVGDYNISHTEKDIFWGKRKLAIDEICREVKGFHTAAEIEKVPQWKHDLANHWPKIQSILDTKQPRKVTTTNPRTKEKFEKYRLAVDVDGTQINLGNHEESPEHCEYYYDFGACHYTCPDTGEETLAQEENLVSVTIVAELMRKLARIEWDLKLQKSIASTDGRTSRAAPPRKWLTEIIDSDGMIDCFRHFYPNAEGRFTCWDQFKNKRYENQGARIDYTLIDKSLLPHLRQGDVTSLRCGGGNNSTEQQDPDSETAALCAVTANGGYQPVSFAGGGIVEASQKTLDTQFGIPHTGHIYTPPSFSDHIGVSVLLDDAVMCSSTLELNEKDKSTKASQPHKKVRTIHSYFGAPRGGGENKQPKKNAANSKSGHISSTIAKTKVTKRKGPIHTFFKPSKKK